MTKVSVVGEFSVIPFYAVGLGVSIPVFPRKPYFIELSSPGPSTTA